MTIADQQKFYSKFHQVNARFVLLIPIGRECEFTENSSLNVKLQPEVQRFTKHLGFQL